MQSKRRDAIEAAFRRLPLLEGIEIHVQSAISALSNVDTHGPGTAPNKFRPLGRGRTQKELLKLAKLADELANHIDELHETTIVALADAHVLSFRLGLPDQLRKIAVGARSTSVPTDPESVPGGRPENKRAHAIGHMLTCYFFMVTGQPPTLRIDAYSDDSTPAGPFMDLVNDVISALEVKVSTEDIARTACDDFRHAKRSKPPPNP
jgi:hypothetical protein